jgi:hypothetical protein
VDNYLILSDQYIETRAQNAQEKDDRNEKWRPWISRDIGISANRLKPWKEDDDIGGQFRCLISVLEVSFRASVRRLVRKAHLQRR